MPYTKIGKKSFREWKKENKDTLNDCWEGFLDMDNTKMSYRKWARRQYKEWKKDEQE